MSCRLGFGVVKQRYRPDEPPDEDGVFMGLDTAEKKQQHQIKSNQIYFSVAVNNNTQYKSIHMSFRYSRNGWSDKLTLTPSLRLRE